MSVKVGYGIGDVLFGMTREDVATLLGSPDEIKQFDECYEAKPNVWVYLDLQMTIRFCDDEGGRVAWIECENPRLTLYGEHIIGGHRDEVVRIMKNHGHDKYDIAEYDTFRELDYVDEWVSFHTTYNLVRGVKIGALFDADDNYVWRYPLSKAENHNDLNDDQGD